MSNENISGQNTHLQLKYILYKCIETKVCSRLEHTFNITQENWTHIGPLANLSPPPPPPPRISAHSKPYPQKVGHGVLQSFLYVNLCFVP